MPDLVRRDILKIKPYIAGKPIEETQRQLGLKEVFKLASNENPLGVSRKALTAIKKNLNKLNRYPDSQGYYLKKRLAAYAGVSFGNIVLGNGSDELIDVVIKTFVEGDENIVTADTTFLEYAIIARVNGRKVFTAPLKNFKYDLEAIRKKINLETKLVFIANPNNPTGTYVNRKELDGFVAGLPKNVILVLDEAYDTFIDVKDFPDSLKYINKNVIILKTFSKAFGMAGLRIGYAIAKTCFTAYMEVVRQPFNVNSLAQVGALAALGDKEFLRKTKKAVSEGKEYLYHALNRLGIKYVPSAANFILIDVEKSGVSVFNDLLSRGVIVREMQQYGLNNFIRVTIGTPLENRKFIEALEKVL